jgi:hypothetical protein
MIHLKVLEKQEHKNKPIPKISRRKEIINVRAQINEMKTKHNTTDQ